MKEAASDEKQAAGTVWSEVHHRLEAAQAAIEREHTPTQQKKKEILRARAETLAREPDAADEDGQHIEVVEFLLAHEKYAIESAYIREVYPLRELTSLPCTPAFALGIISVRGEILSVVDLRRFLDIPEKGLTDRSKVIIIQKDEMEFGILADVILGVRAIPLNEIQPSLPTLTGIRAEYLKGVTSERLVILDAAKVLANKGIIVHEEVEMTL